ncbi:MAG: rhomboid family intramembrane serine protease [Saprospiraceae bacterium]|nr:rhomboid family intramembrane serine protease [Saprospiraceae bacterium]
MENKRPGRFRHSLVFALQLGATTATLHLLRVVTGFPPLSWGIYPRHTEGLQGIVAAPLLHGSWGHLFSNLPPLLALTFILFYFYRRIAWSSFAMIYLLTGAAVWTFGRSVWHVGASGVVYGLVAFIFWSGIFRRNIKSIILALIVLMYYGSMFMGIFPGEEGISWESHLLGAVVGIFTAFWFKNKKETDEQPPRYSWEEEPKSLDEPYFFERDVFEKTKAERRRNFLDRE